MKRPRERYDPVTSPVQNNLIGSVRDLFRPEPARLRPSQGAQESWAGFEAAIHRQIRMRCSFSSGLDCAFLIDAPHGDLRIGERTVSRTVEVPAARKVGKLPAAS